MRPWPLVVMTLGGCAQLAGIEDTSGDGRLGLSLSVERHSIGSTVIAAPQDLSANTATYLVPDAADPAVITPREATETTPGTWTLDVFDATPPVVYDLPDNPGPVFQRQLSLPVKNLLTGFDVLEHPDPVESNLTDTFTVSATLDTPFAAGQSFELFVVGAWTQRALEAPVVGATTLAPPTFAVSTMNSLTGRAKEQITVADTALILRRTGVTLDGSIEAPAMAQQPTNMLMGAFTTHPADRPLSLTISPADAMTRFAAVSPAITVGPAFSWDVHAAPGAAVGNNAGPTLVSGTALMTDVAVTSAYANPFVSKSWPAVLSWVASGTRTLTPDGQGLPITLGAGMQQLVADPAQGLVLDFPAGLPTQISFGATLLSIDNVQIVKPTEPVEISVAVDRQDTTLFLLELRELLPNQTNDALVATRVLFAVSDQSTFVIQPERFQVGKLYTLRVQTISGGFPNVADGDLNTRSLPVATAFVDSGVFRVVP